MVARERDPCGLYGESCVENTPMVDDLMDGGCAIS